LQNSKMFFCPRDNTNSALFQYRNQQISSYVINGAICGYGRANPPAKLSRLSPKGIAFWECADNTKSDCENNFNDGASYPSENTSYRPAMLLSMPLLMVLRELLTPILGRLR